MERVCGKLKAELRTGQTVKTQALNKSGPSTSVQNKNHFTYLIGGQ